MTPTPDFVPTNYTVLNHLGSGQTSHVFLATHPQRGTIALKLPRPEIKEQPLLRRMFESEVQLTMSMQHERIVRALDGFPTGGGAYLTLEYYPGGTLDGLLNEQDELPLTDAYRLILDIIEGLEYSHNRMILHRDVKPANVFLTADIRAKLGDFGTGAWVTEPSNERVGTAFYMAPELFQGKPASVQSDVYSLGILMYEVIAGERPFTGEDYDTLMMQHLNRLPKNPSHHRPKLKNEISRIILKAMSRDASKRFSSVSELKESFMDVTGLRPVAPPKPPPVGRASRTKTVDESANGVPIKEEEEPRGFARWFNRKKS